MVVEPRGAWEHSAYQSDNQFVLEVRAQKVDPNKLVQGAGLRGREAVAELPEHRGARAAAGDRRLHQLQRRHQRHRHRQRHAAPEGRALGSGARHHPAGEEPRPAQVGQRDPDRAQGRAQRQGEDRARGQAADRRARAAAHPVVPAQLRQGRGHRQGPDRPEHRRGGGGTASRILSTARQRRLRDPHQPAVRERHPFQAGGNPGADRQDRHCRAPGADRVAHRHRRRHLRPLARRPPRRRRPARRPRRAAGLQRQRRHPGLGRRQPERGPVADPAGRRGRNGGT